MDTETLIAKQKYLEGFKLIAKLEPYFIETWKKIDGYNYSVSSFGNVKNNTTEKVLKQRVNTNGYYIVDLYKNNKRKTFYIHKLVANSFLENSHNKKCVDHINRIRTDNMLSNLRFATHSENCMNASRKSNNTSGITGVSFSKEKNKWQCHIRINGKLKHLGYFVFKNDALEKRIEAEMKYFGEFRRQ